MDKQLFDTLEMNLENGIQLITIKKTTQISSIHIGIKVGATNEEKKQRGVSHFIEHMLFKGTYNRNNEQLNSELENLGGEYNAYTDYTSTVFNTTMLNEELENGIKLLGDLVQNPTFREEDINKEKGVILAELRSGKDDVEDLSFQKVNEIAFDESPLKIDVIGKESVIKNIQRDEILEYYKAHYTPNNTVITVVSNYDHEHVRVLIEKYFGQWKKKLLNKKQALFEKNKDKIKRTHKNNMEQSTIVYLYTFNDLNKAEELALRVLNHKFGESSNSILFRELREDKGLAYDVYTSLDLTANIKSLYIYASVAKKDIEEGINTIENCIKKVKEGIIVFDEHTINLMKKVFKTAVASTLEDSSDLGNYVLHQAMEGEYIYEFLNDMEEMNRITSEDLYSVARKVLNNPTIHVLICDGDE